MNRLVLVCSVAVGISLSFLYALLAVNFFERLVLSTVTVVELAVLSAELVKVLGLFGYYRARLPRAEVVLRLFFVEVLVVMMFLLGYIATASPFWGDLFTTVFYTWVAATALVVTPYAILVSVVDMTRTQDPLRLLLSPALLFAYLAFAASSLTAFANTFSFATFFPYMVQYANADISAGKVPGLSSVFVLVPSVVVFCSLAVRITFPTPTSATPPRVTFVLPLFGVAVTLGWLYAGLTVVPNTLLAFTVPGIIVLAVLYAYIRR